MNFSVNFEDPWWQTTLVGLIFRELFADAKAENTYLYFSELFKTYPIVAPRTKVIKLETTSPKMTSKRKNTDLGALSTL